jgi:hypothetical protein
MSYARAVLKQRARQGEYSSYADLYGVKNNQNIRLFAEPRTRLTCELEATCVCRRFPTCLSRRGESSSQLCPTDAARGLERPGFSIKGGS